MEKKIQCGCKWRQNFDLDFLSKHAENLVTFVDLIKKSSNLKLIRMIDINFDSFGASRLRHVTWGSYDSSFQPL